MLDELVRRHAEGSLAKSEYIEAMFESHSALFKYADLLSTTDLSKIEIRDGQVLVTVRSSGIQLECDRYDTRQAPFEILNFKAYEPALARAMLAAIKPGDTVWDIGANMGYYALTFAKLAPLANVWAFEPLPVTFGRLQRNALLNGLSNLKLENVGFLDENKEVDFYFEPALSVRASAANLAGDSSVQTVRGRVHRLDDFAQARGLKADVIKCDCEGAELFVFKGALEVLGTQKPIVFSEMLRKWSLKFGYHPNDLITLFSRLGYKCYRFEGEKLIFTPEVFDRTEATNFAFLHDERHAAYIKAWTSKP
ncbi:MAG: FkbM family methyltransferase [Planctomycetes bacterium]|nr:FkbM family methyltransferase [Planctomycetota bacterium]